MSTPKDAWHAVALSREVRTKPVRIMHEGEPVVLFRGKSGIAALVDRCPHRRVELSKGRVVQGDIECPYHGWRFGADGQCSVIPGYLGDLPRYRVKRFKALERDGAIFISDGAPDRDPYVHCMGGQKIAVRHVHSASKSTLIDAAENILDVAHTHFTHKGLLRGFSAKRYKVDVEVTGGADWVEACYTGEDRQDGLISRLLDGERTKTIGRFRYPGIVELEYWGPKEMTIATAFHLNTADRETVNGVGWIMAPDHGVITWAKSLLFKPLMHFALAQDQRVLLSAQRNARFAPDSGIINGPLDFLRTDMERILQGKRPTAADTPRHHTIEL